MKEEPGLRTLDIKTKNVVSPIGSTSSDRSYHVFYLFLVFICSLFLSVPFTRKILLQIKLPGKDIICYCIKSRCAGHAEDGGEQHIILNRLNGVLRIADKRRGVTAYGEINAADNLHYHIDNKVRDYSPEDSVFPEQVTKCDRRIQHQRSGNQTGDAGNGDFNQENRHIQVI